MIGAFVLTANCTRVGGQYNNPEHWAHLEKWQEMIIQFVYIKGITNVTLSVEIDDEFKAITKILSRSRLRLKTTS